MSRTDESFVEPLTTEQVGHVPNPTGKGGFGDHPEHRNPGGWDKTKSISYQYNRMLRMTDDEWAELAMRIKSGNTFRAERIAFNRINDADKDLNATKEITDRTEGKAPQSIKLDADVNTRPLAGYSDEDIRKLAGK